MNESVMLAADSHAHLGTISSTTGGTAVCIRRRQQHSHFLDTPMCFDFFWKGSSSLDEVLNPTAAADDDDAVAEGTGAILMRKTSTAEDLNWNERE